MLRGVVNDRREAVVNLTVRGPTGATLDVQAIVDTGFTGSMTLPPATVAVLGLSTATARRATMGDGVVRQLDAHDAEVLWDGAWRRVMVYATGREPLIGMRLLGDHWLRVEVRPGGRVEVDRLS